METHAQTSGARHKVVIVGGGFGGLYAAKVLADKPVEVTLIDRTNHHLFQPLLYQVATAGAFPGRHRSTDSTFLKEAQNITGLMDRSKRIDAAAKVVRTGREILPFRFSDCCDRRSAFLFWQ